MIKRSTNQLKFLLENVFKPIWEDPTARPLRETGKQEAKNDHHEIITMNLNIIKSRLERSLYRSARDCTDDFNTMFTNCRRYFKRGDDVVVTAERFEKIFKILIKGMPTEELEEAPRAVKRMADSMTPANLLPKRPKIAELATTGESDSQIKKPDVKGKSKEKLLDPLRACKELLEEFMALNSDSESSSSSDDESIEYLLNLTEQIKQMKETMERMVKKATRKKRRVNHQGVDVESVSDRVGPNTASVPIIPCSVLLTRLMLDDLGFPVGLNKASAVDPNKTHSDEDDNSMSYEERKQLSLDIVKLSDDNLQRVVQMIPSYESLLEDTNSKDIEIDFDSLKPSTLRKMETFVASCLRKNVWKKVHGESNQNDDTIELMEVSNTLPSLTLSESSSSDSDNYENDDPMSHDEEKQLCLDNDIGQSINKKKINEEQDNSEWTEFFELELDLFIKSELELLNKVPPLMLSESSSSDSDNDGNDNPMSYDEEKQLCLDNDIGQSNNKKNITEEQDNIKLTEFLNKFPPLMLSDESSSSDSDSDEDDNPMSNDQLNQLCLDIAKLSDVNLQHVVLMIPSHETLFKDTNSENVELDFASLEPSTLRKIETYVASCL